MSEKSLIDADLHLLNHPFYVAWAKGQLSTVALKDYAEQYYHHVKAFPGYLEAAIAVCENESAKRILEENLADERGETHGVSHPELWLRFAEGLGAQREDVERAPLRNAILELTRTIQNCSQGSYPEALGAIFAYESQVPEVAHSKIEGLKVHYGITDERSLAFFEVHKLADVEHRDRLFSLIEDLEPEAKSQAQVSARKVCQVLWNFLSDVESLRH